MDPSSLVPHYQPLPFPAPVWLLQTLLVLGFFLHVIPMNVALGGGLTSAVCLLAGRRDPQSYYYRIGKGLATGLPLFISFAITQGIVPLLFLQLLYGPMFYTSSILMAVPWLSIIFLLVVAYYASYLVIYRYLKRSDRGIASPLILFACSLLFMVIAYFFTANMTLMLTPEKWLQMYQSNIHGLNLPHDKQIAPRLLHSFIASLAVCGLTIGCFGLARKGSEPEYANWLIRKGSQLFVIFTSLQIPVGLWFLFSLPEKIGAKFFGQDPIATAAFAISMLMALVAFTCTTLSSVSGSSTPFKGGLISAIVLILSMVVTRHELRTFYLQNLIHPERVPVSTQWDLLIVFVLSAVALIVYLVWLARLVWNSLQTPPPDLPKPRQLESSIS